MMDLSLFVDGIALWTPQWPNWASAQSALLADSGSAVGLNPSQPPFLAPKPSLLTPAERRRAPTTVALALEVAQAATEMSGLSADELNTVFTSVHGDLTINDAMCRALIDAPLLVSPTKFINSVHNAPAGYWAIATGCRQTSTALSAFDQSFTAGLFEAALQAVANDQAVLLVGYDMAATGPLADVAASRGPMALGLVLSPRGSSASKCTLSIRLQTRSDAAPTPCRSAASASLISHGMKEALPLMEALAACIGTKSNSIPIDTVVMPLSSFQSLHVQLQACIRHAPSL